MADYEVESLNSIEEFESLEDLTVYEVVAEYRENPPTSTTNYPRVFYQLQDGQIINAESCEIIISLSQFVAPKESAELFEGDTTSIISSQTSPRPLQIDIEYMTSTQEDTTQQEVQQGETSLTFEQLSQPLLAHEETIIAESTLEDVEGEVMREVRSLISYPPAGRMDGR